MFMFRCLGLFITWKRNVDEKRISIDLSKIPVNKIPSQFNHFHDALLFDNNNNIYLKSNIQCT